MTSCDRAPALSGRRGIRIVEAWAVRAAGFDARLRQGARRHQSRRLPTPRLWRCGWHMATDQGWSSWRARTAGPPGKPADVRPPVVSSSEGPRCWPTRMRIGSHAGAGRLSALRQARRVMRPHHLAALVLLPHRRGQQVQGPLRQFGSIPERDGKSTTYFLYEGMAEIYRQGSSVDARVVIGHVCHHRWFLQVFLGGRDRGVSWDHHTLPASTIDEGMSSCFGALLRDLYVL